MNSVAAHLLRVIVLLAVLGGPACAEERIALLIGNQKYAQTVGPLQNPLNDIALVGAALGKVGFEVMPAVKDASRIEMLRAVRKFARKLRAAGPGAIGFFYYSGHGATETEIGPNYLIPVDVRNTEDASLWDASVRLKTVIDRLRRGAPRAALFIVFDACRNELKTRDKSVSKGFVAERQEEGVYIAFATAENRKASDAGKGSGPYAKALAAEIVKPGQHHLDMFLNVKQAVFRATGQTPWDRSGLLRRIYFAGRKAAPPKRPAPRPSTLPSPGFDSRALDLAFWNDIKDSKDPADFKDYLARFPKGVFSGRAKRRLERLKRKLTVVAPPPPAPPGCEDILVKVAAREECLKPGDAFRDCRNCPEMVVVPAGRFMMGSPKGEKGRDDDEGPQHEVRIGEPFAVGKFEVTFDEWDACVADRGCKGHRPNDRGWGRGRRPVIYVSWEDAKAYGAWLSRKTGKRYRLLTEAEWEYAARAGTTTRFSFGDDASALCAYGNGADQSTDFDWRNKACNDGVSKRTAKVGHYKANLFGLHDMHGNVWEWVEDCYRENYKGAPKDGSAWTTGSCRFRVLRGGSWILLPRNLRSAYRYRDDPDFRRNVLGFRLARALTP